MDNQSINHFIDYDLNISIINLVFEKRYFPNWRYEEKVGRSFHGLVYVMDGIATYYTHSNKFEIGKNNMVYLPKGSRYLTIGSSASPCHLIVASFDLDNSILPWKTSEPYAIRLADTNNYKNMFHDMERKWFYKGIAYKLKCKSILQDILYNLINDTVQQEMHVNNLPRIQAAVNYMETYYDNPIMMEELASMVRLSVSHFRRLFKEIFKISPQEYLNLIRINKAKDLIMSEMYPIGEIAEKVGYSNIYYFSRAFKKITGDCPTQYKRK